MPSSRVLISSQTLGTSAASVTFSGIPSGYRDLVLKYSARGTASGVSINAMIKVNTDTSTNYSRTNLFGDGSSVTSVRGTSEDRWYFGFSINGSTATANTFSNSELYIPNYTVSANKPTSGFSVTETNATAADLGIVALLWRNTAAITSLELTPLSGSFVTGSSFYLYGLLPA